MATYSKDGQEVIARRFRQLADKIESGELKVEECTESLGIITYFYPDDTCVRTADNGTRRLNVLFSDPEKMRGVELLIEGAVPSSIVREPPV